MSTRFSLRYICENNISKVKLVNDMPVGYLLLNFDDNGTYMPPCEWVIGDIYYNLPLREDTIDQNLVCFTYVDNEETFGDYLYNELMDKIREVKKQRAFKKY